MVSSGLNREFTQPDEDVRHFVRSTFCRLHEGDTVVSVTLSHFQALRGRFEVVGDGETGVLSPDLVIRCIGAQASKRFACHLRCLRCAE